MALGRFKRTPLQTSPAGSRARGRLRLALNAVAINRGRLRADQRWSSDTVTLNPLGFSPAGQRHQNLSDQTRSRVRRLEVDLRVDIELATLRGIPASNGETLWPLGYNAAPMKETEGNVSAMSVLCGIGSTSGLAECWDAMLRQSATAGRRHESTRCQRKTAGADDVATGRTSYRGDVCRSFRRADPIVWTGSISPSFG
jgi:hypothetical protein